MVNKVSQWCNLGEGQYLDANLNSTTNKSQKTSLWNAFRQSTSQLQVNSNITDDQLVQMARTAKARYDKALHQANWVQKIFHRIFLAHAYNRFIDKIVFSLAERNASSFRNVGLSLMLKCDGIEFLANKVRDAVMTKIWTRTDFKPFLYEIRTKTGTLKGHLVGTCHHSCLKSFKEPALSKIAAQCRELVSEVGDVELNFWQKLRARLSKNYLQKLPLDDGLVLLTHNHGSKISALETCGEQFKVQVLGYSAVMKDLGVQAPESIEFLKYLDNLANESLDAWLKNDGKRFSYIADKLYTPHHREIFLNQRNNKWIHGQNGLKLKLEAATPQKTVCVACGALHLFGTHGLIKELRKIGYKVTKLPG